MQILITGAAGFIGQILAKELLSDQQNAIILADIVQPPIPSGSKYPENAKAMKLDLLKDASGVITRDLDAAYLFHGIMSSGSEANFELGLSVNVDSTRGVLECIRKTRPGLRVIYASSCAVYGTPFPAVISEADLPTPESSYGCQKMICEMLINDYTRRGYITGFTLRFPTITVRPGKPTAAASSFISGIIREPLAGQRCVVPMTNRGWKHWVCSPKTLVYNLVLALSFERDCLPPHKRSINVPGFQVTIQDMRDALEEVGGKEALALVDEEDDPLMKPILESWGDCYDNSLALGLGMKQDKSFVETVLEYKKGIEQSS